VFGIDGWEFVVLLIVALLVIGPERMPEYSAKLGRLVKQVRLWRTRPRCSCASRWVLTSMTSTGNSTTLVSTTLAGLFVRL
jgi:hypothetical protein